MISIRILILCLLLAALLGPVRAEDAPTLLVGRISAADGGVAVRPSGGEWADAGVNMPIAARMAVRTNLQGGAWLRIGADTVALAANTELDLAQLDASGMQIVLHHGRVGVWLSQLDPAHWIEIAVPRGAVWLASPGDYEIGAGDAQAPGRVAVFEGSARFVGKGADTAVAAGWATVLSGGDRVATRLAGAVDDDFVAWWRRSAGDSANSPALQHVSAEMTGYDALDGHGTWETVNGYGAVWFPTALPNNWAPYRFGQWRWIGPWGWTWIDDAPWGFAPSHYGRWARFAGTDGGGSERWGWVPGGRFDHPQFMPAAVAFLGTAGIGLSYPDASGPAVGWFPLAPGEVYWPSYTHDLGAIRRLNRGAVADVLTIGQAADGGPPAAIVDGDYQNRRFASVVPRAVFVGGKPVADALVQLPEQRLDNAPLLAGSPQIAPAAPHPVAVASVAAPAKLARAVRTLARILLPHGRAAVIARLQVRNARPGRLHVIRAVFSRAPHRYLRRAAIRHRR